MYNELENYCVYIHTNRFNNKVYVGITMQDVQDRWKNGSGYREDEQPVFAMAIKKYGWENFDHIIFAENLTEQEAKYIEILLIALYKSNCKRYTNPQYGYNMTDGGDGMSGHHHSKETHKKLSDKTKERFANPENHPLFGKHFSEESREKMSAAQKGKHIGEKNPFYGKHHTEESVKKNKLSHKHEAKTVEQYTTDGELVATFFSIHDASKATGINRQCISFCIQGKYKKAGGYIWKTVEAQ